MLLTTDIHLTDKDQDSYRFGIFPWIEEQVLAYGLKDVLILGDLTDFKDYHSSRLVNAITDALCKISKQATVHILKGNHDYTDAKNPFFGFLKHFPNINYYQNITKVSPWLFLPHTRTPELDWASLDLEGLDYVFMHESVIGSVTSDHYALEHGLATRFFRSWPKKIKILSGDIHLPQTCGRVEYIGSPYRVRLGDNFNPRVVVIKQGKQTNIKFPCITKMTVEIKQPEDLLHLNINKGDQVKVRLKIDKSCYPDWAELRLKILRIGCDLEADFRGVELITVKRRKRIKKSTCNKFTSGSAENMVRLFSDIENLDSYTTRTGIDLVTGQG